MVLSAMEKGLIWIELEGGLRQLGCPICNVLAQGSERIEGVLDMVSDAQRLLDR